MKISIKLLFKDIVFKFHKNSSVTFALSAVYELIRLEKITVYTKQKFNIDDEHAADAKTNAKPDLTGS